MNEASAGMGCGEWLAAGVFFVFLALGVCVFAFSSAIPLWNWQSARDWPATSCVIADSALLSERDSEGDVTYRADVGYRWQVGGRSYYGSRFSHFADNEPVFGERAGRIEDYFPPQTPITCYVDPADPTNAVRSQQFDSSSLAGVFALAFVLAIAALFRFARDYIDPAKPWRPLQQPVVVTDAYGERVLPTQGELLEINLTFFSGGVLLWNGVMVWAWLDNYPLFAFDKLMLTILLPLSAFGLYLFALALNRWLKLLNPRPILSTRYSEFRVGKPFGLHLRLQGGRRRIGRILVTLQGREIAIYREGSNTQTEEQIFFSETLLATEESDASFDVAVAPNLMHSLETKNNEIAWTLRAIIVLASGKEVNHEWKLWLEPAHSTKSQP